MSRDIGAARRRIRWSLIASATLIAIYTANVLLGAYAQKTHAPIPWLLGNTGEATLVSASIALFVYAFLMIETIERPGR